ncbi:MAG: NAD-dependent epimerase/dehydratase family protein [Deltaproteobacteria bacterium]|nr:NAD-dependent epimerase/dehydratase family protein [Deltaproteobacteria bacterium]
MRVAITGGTGCLGLPMVKRLISDEAYLKILTLPNDLSASYFDNNKVEIITGDLNSPNDLDRLCLDCDVVFHLAGMVHTVPGTEEEEQEFFRVNVEGTRNLLEVAKKNRVKRVVFYSTVGVYGKDSDFHGDELSPCRPSTVYAKSKYLAEQLVLNSYNDGGPEGVVLRFPVVYGPLDRGNVAHLIRAIKKKRFVYFGSALHLRSLISSKNAAEAAYLAANKPKAANQIFCVTNGVDYTMKHLVETICKGLGTSWRPMQIPLSLGKSMGIIGDILERLFHRPMPINSNRVRKLSRPLTFSCKKIQDILGYQPVRSLQDGIKDEIRWLRSVENWI